MKRVLIWFRKDLRIHDQEALFRATAENCDVLPVFIKTQPIIRELPFRKGDASIYQKLFLEESLFDLDNSFRIYGGNLIVQEGNPIEIIPKLCLKYLINTVYASMEYAPDEVSEQENLEKELNRQSVELYLFHSGNLIHPNDIPFHLDTLPDIFTAFRKKIEKYSAVRDCFPSINEIKYIPHTEVDYDFNLEGVKSPFSGGEMEGLKRLHEYIHVNQLVKKYKQTRNGLLGLDYSSKFSPWLAWGCLSVRRVFEEISIYEKEVTANESTYWLKFELLWREYFRYVMMKFGNRMFTKGGLKLNNSKGEINPALFEKWCTGNTGQEFIDANMIELKCTGYMSNRGRQNVASYLVHDLGIDWRMGASYFEKMLVDYDVYSNWGNWAYIAGVGNDPRENRKFNPERQAEMYDPSKEFVNYWLSQTN